MLFEVVISTVFTICIVLSGTTLFVKNREYALLNGPGVAGPVDSFEPISHESAIDRFDSKGKADYLSYPTDNTLSKEVIFDTLCADEDLTAFPLHSTNGSFASTGTSSVFASNTKSDYWMVNVEYCGDDDADIGAFCDPSNVSFLTQPASIPPLIFPFASTIPSSLPISPFTASLRNTSAPANIMVTHIPTTASLHFESNGSAPCYMVANIPTTASFCLDSNGSAPAYAVTLIPTTASLRFDPNASAPICVATHVPTASLRFDPSASVPSSHIFPIPSLSFTANVSVLIIFQPTTKPFFFSTFAPVNTTHTSDGVYRKEIPPLPIGSDRVRQPIIIPVNDYIGHVEITTRKYDIADLVADMGTILVEWSFWLFYTVSGCVRITDVIFVVVMILFFRITRKGEKNLQDDLKETHRRELAKIVAEKGVLQEKIISIKAQLADEEFSNKKKNTELLQKLQTFELKMYQMKTEFLNAQDHFESIIVLQGANQRIMAVEREVEMKLRKAKEDADTMFSEAREANERKLKAVTQDCEESLRKEMEKKEKRLSHVEGEHRNELFKVKAEYSRLKEENRFLKGTEEKLAMVQAKLREIEERPLSNVDLDIEPEYEEKVIEYKECGPPQASSYAIESHPQNYISLGNAATNRRPQQILYKRVLSYFSRSSAGNSSVVEMV